MRFFVDDNEPELELGLRLMDEDEGTTEFKVWVATSKPDEHGKYPDQNCINLAIRATAEQFLDENEGILWGDFNYVKMGIHADDLKKFTTELHNNDADGLIEIYLVLDGKSFNATWFIGYHPSIHFKKAKGNKIIAIIEKVPNYIRPIILTQYNRGGDYIATITHSGDESEE